MLEIEEDKQYEVQQMEQIKVMELKEKQKVISHQKKILEAKLLRDKQIQIEHDRRDVQKLADKRMEEDQVRQLQKELDQESKDAIQKRKFAVNKMQMLIAENEKHKAKRMYEQEMERKDDVDAQLKYIEILDQQEKDKV